MKKIKFNPKYILGPEHTAKDAFTFKTLFEMTFPELGIEEDLNFSTYWVTTDLYWDSYTRVNDWIEIYIKAFGKVRQAWPN